MDEIKLRPCPFCGFPAQTKAWEECGKKWFIVECGWGFCDVQPVVTRQETYEQAAKIWNGENATKDFIEED